MVPKFRAWDKHVKKIRKVTEIHSDDSLIYLKANNGKGYYCSFSDIVLMQSTGLKDKNGVEIFEGDIVRWHDVVTWDYSVTFKDGVFCISDDPSSNFYHLKEDINGKFEVIGNIYENPELLEPVNEN